MGVVQAADVFVELDLPDEASEVSVEAQAGLTASTVQDNLEQIKTAVGAKVTGVANW